MNRREPGCYHLRWKEPLLPVMVPGDVSRAGPRWPAASLFLAALGLAPHAASPATPALAGREFWFALPRLQFPARLEVLACAPTAVEISGRWVASGTAAPGAPFVADVPRLSWSGSPNTSGPWGIRVATPDADSQVFLRLVSPEGEAETRAAVHPAGSLGSGPSSYVLDLPTEGVGTRRATITAIADGTSVSVDGLCGSSGPPLIVVLDRGDAYHVTCPAGTALGGARIDSSAPVSVLASEDCDYITQNACCCEPLLYMPSALRYWGTRHYVLELPRGTAPTQDFDYLRLVASSDGTRVEVDDGAVRTFVVDHGPGLMVELGRAAVVTSDRPISVFLYEQGASNRGILGDPDVFPIVPEHGYGTAARFLAESGWDTDTLLTIVTADPAMCRLELDGAPRLPSWQPFPGGRQSHATLTIPGGGEHEIQASSPVALYSHAQRAFGSLGTDLVRRFASPSDCVVRVASCAIPVGNCPGRLAACAGQAILLDFTGTTAVNCPTGLTYRWTVNGIPQPAWDGMASVTAVFAVDSVVEIAASCTGLPGCDDRVSFTVAVTPDPVPGDQGNVLLGVRRGIDAEFLWPAAPAALWTLDRDPVKTAIGRTTWIAETAARSELDTGAIPRAGTDFYALRGLSPCSKTPGP